MNNKLVIGLCLFVFLISSCKYHEEVYLKSNGKLDYKFSLTSKMPFGSLGDSAKMKSKSKDTTIHFRDMISEIKTNPKYEDKRKSLEDKNVLDQLDNLEPFSMRIKMDGDAMLYEFLANDIKDQVLLKASKAMKSSAIKNTLKGKAKSMDSDENLFMTEKSLNWNGGKTFLYKGEEIEKDKKESDSLSELTDKFSKMAMQGVFTRTFKFDSPVKAVNLKNAIISEDKKTVTITYDMEEYQKGLKSKDLRIILN